MICDNPGVFRRDRIFKWRVVVVVVTGVKESQLLVLWPWLELGLELDKNSFLSRL